MKTGCGNDSFREDDMVTGMTVCKLPFTFNVYVAASLEFDIISAGYKPSPRSAWPFPPNWKKVVTNFQLYVRMSVI
ncbi:MAG: hypothetical protein A3F16_03200 [Deltaproteobacteria bacterium RIFCSPHIGHO2_12_FULL_43_9]|nr:MAG: hypothetical protein A3F16_03200 [Deltaproteobacteria bacterium RIFCSPHIGHO2_12_FULL_43_9]